MDLYLRNAIAELLMPPGIWIFLALLVALLLRKHPKSSWGLVLSFLVMIWLTATPFFTQMLSQWSQPVLSWPQAIDTSSIKEEKNQTKFQLPSNTDHATQASLVSDPPQAIVILGGGLRLNALDHQAADFVDVSTATIERLRLGAQLAKQSSLPILVSGGVPPGSRLEGPSEAAVMARVLKNELGVEVKWLEKQSKTTQENANFSARLLREEKITHVYLVSQYWHLPRAQWIFEQEGFKVTPAPTGFESSPQWTPMDFYPSSLHKTRQIWHELISVVWYRWRYKS